MQYLANYSFWDGQVKSEIRRLYTKVLQGHIAIDIANFPEGTTVAQLHFFARTALEKNPLNYTVSCLG